MRSPRYRLDHGFQLEPRRPGEEARHVATCPLFATGRARYWGFTIVGVTNGSPFMPPFFDPVLHVAGAGREFMCRRDGKLPSPKAFDDFLAEGYRVRLRYAAPTFGQ